MSEEKIICSATVVEKDGTVDINLEALTDPVKSAHCAALMASGIVSFLVNEASVKTPAERGTFVAAALLEINRDSFMLTLAEQTHDLSAEDLAEFGRAFIETVSRESSDLIALTSRVASYFGVSTTKIQ